MARMIPNPYGSDKWHDDDADRKFNDILRRELGLNNPSSVVDAQSLQRINTAMQGLSNALSKSMVQNRKATTIARDAMASAISDLNDITYGKGGVLKPKLNPSYELNTNIGEYIEPVYTHVKNGIENKLNTLDTHRDMTVLEVRSMTLFRDYQRNGIYVSINGHTRVMFYSEHDGTLRLLKPTNKHHDDFNTEIAEELYTAGIKTSKSENGDEDLSFGMSRTQFDYLVDAIAKKHLNTRIKKMFTHVNNRMSTFKTIFLTGVEWSSDRINTSHVLKSIEHEYENDSFEVDGLVLEGIGDGLDSNRTWVCRDYENNVLFTVDDLGEYVRFFLADEPEDLHEELYANMKMILGLWDANGYIESQEIGTLGIFYTLFKDKTFMDKTKANAKAYLPRVVEVALRMFNSAKRIKPEFLYAGGSFYAVQHHAEYN